LFASLGKKKSLEDPVTSPEQKKQNGSWTFTHEPMVILPKRTTGIRTMVILYHADGDMSMK
jgi:hypothetical protein